MVPRALPWARDLLGFQPAQPRNPAAKIRLIRTSAASAVQNPEFNTPKIAKRLVRNNHAKKCCIFSLKCLDVNNLIHNFVTQVKIGCTLAKPIFAPKAKIGYTSAKLTSKLASSALGLHYLYP